MKKISTAHIKGMSDAQCRQMATHYYLRAKRAEMALDAETRMAVERCADIAEVMADEADDDAAAEQSRAVAARIRGALAA